MTIIGGRLLQVLLGIYFLLLLYDRYLTQEDIGIIERMQAGRSSDGFDGGVLSPYWDPLQQHFARLLRDSIAAHCDIES